MMGKVFLFVILFGSWFYHISFRESHFQECDSSSVYYSIYRFPESAIQYMKGCYYIHPTDPAAEALANSKNALSTAARFFKSDLTPQELAIHFSNPMRAIRLGMIEVAHQLSRIAPFSIRAAFALPLSSTYSPGAGFVYGLINRPESSYKEFMSRSLLLTLTLFHFAVMLVYLICVRFGLSSWAGMGASFIMLFSISEYSYGYHLGSTVWNLMTGCVWLLIFQKRMQRKVSLVTFSLLSGVLFLFNYLLMPIWAASVLYEFARKLWLIRKERKPFVPTLIRFAFAILPAVVLVGSTILLFVQPSAGANTAILAKVEFKKEWFDIWSNFLVFFPTRLNAEIGNVGILILGVLLAVRIGFLVLKTKSKKSQLQISFFVYVTLLMLVIQLMTMKSLFALTPSRHILFLSAFVFGLIGFALDVAFSKLPKWITLGLIVLIVGAGIKGVNDRRPDVASTLPLPELDELVKRYSVKNIGIYGCSYDLYFHEWPNGATVHWSDGPVEVKPGSAFAYISQIQGFKESDLDYLKKERYPSYRISEVQKIARPSSTYFIAFNPDPSRFVHHMPNGYFLSIITAENKK